MKTIAVILFLQLAIGMVYGASYDSEKSVERPHFTMKELISNLVKLPFGDNEHIIKVTECGVQICVDESDCDAFDYFAIYQYARANYPLSFVAQIVMSVNDSLLITPLIPLDPNKKYVHTGKCEGGRPVPPEEEIEVSQEECERYLKTIHGARIYDFMPDETKQPKITLEEVWEQIHNSGVDEDYHVMKVNPECGIHFFVTHALNYESESFVSQSDFYFSESEFSSFAENHPDHYNELMLHMRLDSTEVCSFTKSPDDKQLYLHNGMCFKGLCVPPLTVKAAYSKGLKATPCVGIDYSSLPEEIRDGKYPIRAPCP